MSSIDGLSGADVEDRFCCVRAVVGVAVIAGGRVLVARRSRPPALAGLWELPGGKVESDEDPGAAAVREMAEELSCVIEVTGWLAGASPAGPGLVLRVATARLAGGDPVPTEHDAVRWLGPGQLDQVTWVPADVLFLEPLRAALRGTG